MLWKPTPRNTVLRMKLYRHDPLLVAVKTIDVAAGPTVTADGDSENEQAVCVIVTVWPAMVIVPCRVAPLLFWSIRGITVPLPVPPLGVLPMSVPPSQSAPALAVHAHDPVIVTAIGKLTPQPLT